MILINSLLKGLLSKELLKSFVHIEKGELKKFPNEPSESKFECFSVTRTACIKYTVFAFDQLFGSNSLIKKQLTSVAITAPIVDKVSVTLLEQESHKETPTRH